MEPEALACKTREVASTGGFKSVWDVPGFQRLGLQQTCYPILTFLCDAPEIFYRLNGVEHIMATFLLNDFLLPVDFNQVDY